MDGTVLTKLPIGYYLQWFISYIVFEGESETHTQPLTIENEWLGDFSWSASESFEWLSLSKNSGQVWDTISIDINPVSLIAGSFVEPLLFSSPDADGSPDTVFIAVDVINDIPYIKVEPDTFFIYTDNLTEYDSFLVVSNFGTGSLNWQAQSNAGWLSLDKTGGFNTDTIYISVNDTLINFGTSTASIIISDNESFNKTVNIPFIVNYYNPSLDTIKVSSTSVEAEKSSSVSILCNLVNTSKSIYLPLKYDTTYLIVDSVLPGVNHSEILNFSTSIDQLMGEVILTWEVNTSDTFISVGESHLAELFFTTNAYQAEISIDTILTDSKSIQIQTYSDSSFTPNFVKSDIVISAPTDIGDYNIQPIPLTFELFQNYPNPFNSSTVIEYQLPVKTKLKLEIFNILGQKVKTIVNQMMPAGIYQTEWNGRNENDISVATGLYFYRLNTDNHSKIKKMLLLK